MSGRSYQKLPQKLIEFSILKKYSYREHLKSNQKTNTFFNNNTLKVISKKEKLCER